MTSAWYFSLIPNQHELRTFRNTRDHGLDLMGRQLLRLIQNKEAPRNGTSPDKAEGLNLYHPAANEPLVRLDGRRTMMTTGTTAVRRLRLRHHRHHLIIFLFLTGFFLRELRFFRWLRGDQYFQSIVIGRQN